MLNQDPLVVNNIQEISRIRQIITSQILGQVQKRHPLQKTIVYKVKGLIFHKISFNNNKISIRTKTKIQILKKFTFVKKSLELFNMMIWFLPNI